MAERISKLIIVVELLSAPQWCRRSRKAPSPDGFGGCRTVLRNFRDIVLRNSGTESAAAATSIPVIASAFGTVLQAGRSDVGDGEEQSPSRQVQTFPPGPKPSDAVAGTLLVHLSLQAFAALGRRRDGCRPLIYSWRFIAEWALVSRMNT
jgi:hypothetical protein